MTHPADHYSYRTAWYAPDQKFVATCIELPGLSHLDTTPESALRGIRDLVRFCLDDMVQNNEPIPEAAAEANFSGQFVTRVPKMLHAQLALEARENGVSLNALVNTKLAVPLGYFVLNKSAGKKRPVSL